MASRWVANTPWPKLEVQELIRLRADGVGPAEIARRLQRTENSVTSKIRQLRLPNMVERPAQPEAPRDAAGHYRPRKAEPAPQAGRVTLPPLPSLQEE